MILRVSDLLPQDEASLNEVCISLDEFADIRRHPFIASNKFDAVVVDLDKKVPVGYLAAVMNVARVIPHIVHDEYTLDDIRLLAELYPDKAAELRFSYIRDKERLKMLILELKQAYDWQSYY